MAAFPSFARCLLGTAVVLGACGVASAQSLPEGVRLGMSAEALRDAVPEAQRVARPQRLPGGLAGLWRGAPSLIGGLAFDPTFFFAAGALQRVEWLAAADSLPDRGDAAFGALLDWGRARFGTETAARDPGSRYASWATEDTDVYLQRADGAGHVTVRLVYKTRVRKDGSEL